MLQASKAKREGEGAVVVVRPVIGRGRGLGAGAVGIIGILVRRVWEVVVWLVVLVGGWEVGARSDVGEYWDETG